MAKIEEIIRANSHPLLDRDLAVAFGGTIGSGKSTFLTGIHTELAYHKQGIEIQRGRKSGITGLIDNGYHGINRPNATVSSADKLPVFGYTPNGMIVMQLYAPGSHFYAAALDGINEDAFAFFLDLQLLQHTLAVLENNEETEFFPFKNTRGIAFRQKNPWEGGRFAEIFAKHPYGTFKRDELGISIESLLFAQQKLQERKTKGIPIIGIQSYSAEKIGGISNVAIDNIARAEEALNSLIGRYLAYLGKNGFPYQFREDEIAAVRFDGGDVPKHNEAVRRVDFSAYIPPQDWFMVDSAQTKRIGVKEAAYRLAVAALEKRGMAAEGFRLVRFKEFGKEDPLTIHYKKINF